MIKLSASRLARLGYHGLTREQTNELLRELYKAGEEIVGLKLGSMMSTAQLDAFEQLFVAGDEAGALVWLERNFPKYRELVQEIFKELDDVLRQAVDVTSRQPEPAGRETD